MHLCSPTQLRLFPPRTCCVSSSRRNPNWTTWWVLDVSNISNSAWIERIRVSRNQTHINFYQNWKYWVCFIASHISIKEVSGISFYSCYKKAALGSFLMSKITKFTKTTFRALAGSRKMDVPHPTSHTTHTTDNIPQPHTVPHTTYHSPTPPHPLSFCIWIDELRLSGSHRRQPEGVTNQTTNTGKRYLQYLKRILWKKQRLKIQRKLSHNNSPLELFNEYFSLLWCWGYHSFVLGNQWQLEFAASSPLTQKLQAS